MLRILHLEDNRRDATLIRSIFETEKLDCEIVHVRNQEEFESAVAQDRFDVILSDYSLPNYNGFTALDFAHLRTPDVPFILLSGTLGEELAVESLKTGATDYILKGRLNRLVPAVRRAVSEAQERAERKRAEEALEQIRRQHELILHSTGEGIFGLDLNGAATFVNPSAADLLGYKVEELIGQPMHALIHHTRPDGSAYRVKDSPIYATFKSGVPCHVGNEVFWRKDGTSFCVEYVSNPILDEERKLIGAVVTFRDIRERKRAEEELRATHAKLRHLLEHSPAVTYALTIEGERAVPYAVSENISDLLGFTLEEALSYDWWVTHLHPEDRDRAIASLKATLTHGVSRTEYRIGRKNGGYRWVEDSRRLIRDTSRQSKEIVGVWNDITDRKQAEEALVESEAKFRQLSDNIQEVFWITSPDSSRVIYASPAYEKIWKRPLAELYQSPSTRFDVILPEDRASVISAFGSLNEGAGQARIEYRIRQPDGSIRWILDRGFPVYDSAGRVYRLAGIAKDISEHKQLEDHLRQSQKMEAIGQLAGGIAHDFNNILGCIVGYAELALLEAADAKAVEENLEEVLRASQRAKELVLQILTFSRQQEQERRPLRLQPVIQEALKLLRASLPSTIQIRADVAADAPAVLADATQIHQIVMNIATNAAHAMSGKPGQLGVALAARDIDANFTTTNPDLKAGSYVALSISDTGCGMDEPTLRRIFEPFFTTKPPGEGTGLGLAVVHGIVKSHEGAITVESEPGKGTTFHLYFPAYGQAASEAAAQVAGIPRGTGQHVLFIDDEPPLAFLGKKLLERAGYNVTAKSNPTEALAAFRANPADYDLVITDLTMPQLTGADLATEFLKLRRDIPVILATGFTGTMNAEKAHALGVRDLLMKPFTVQSLAEAAHLALTKGK